jgi:FlaA1/EpsC-like NDP-sugar epimerase
MMISDALKGARVLVTGGTGSLGTKLTERLLKHDIASLKIFSRDEAKQYFMSKKYEAEERLQFQIGDIRNLTDVVGALQGIDVVFNTAALKQVPSCETAPFQAIQTNCLGAENIVSAISTFRMPVRTVVGISTDKACKPTTVMGMTKALQERIFLHGNLRCQAQDTKFVCARYGNILASRGSLIPLFHHLIADNKPLTVTSTSMTRFLMNLDQAVDLIFSAMAVGQPGETYIPRVGSGKIIDIAEIFSEISGAPVKITGIRPGEKLHEILVSEEEMFRTHKSGDVFVIKSELVPSVHSPEFLSENRYNGAEYSSMSDVATKGEVLARLQKEDLLPGQFDFQKYK